MESGKAIFNLTILRNGDGEFRGLTSKGDKVSLVTSSAEELEMINSCLGQAHRSGLFLTSTKKSDVSEFGFFVSAVSVLLPINYFRHF